MPDLSICWGAVWSSLTATYGSCGGLSLNRSLGISQPHYEKGDITLFCGSAATVQTACLFQHNLGLCCLCVCIYKCLKCLLVSVFYNIFWILPVIIFYHVASISMFFSIFHVILVDCSICHYIPPLHTQGPFSPCEHVIMSLSMPIMLSYLLLFPSPFLPFVGNIYTG